MLIPSVGTSCPRCGGPSDELNECCLDCSRRPPPQQASVVWGEYDGVLRSSILALKRRGHDELVGALASRLATRVGLRAWAASIDTVSCVPSHPLRQIKRGPAAAEAVARSLAHSLGLPFAATLRRRGLRRQASRTRVQRLQLGHRSFACRAAVAGRRLLVVDDVVTTGATLRRVAETLLEAGAEAVFCAAIARTPDARRAT
jgi:ComF family protein